MIEKILNEIKDKIQSMENISEKYLESKGTNNGFEKLVPIVVREIIEKYNNSYGEKINLHIHYGHHFPDIDISIGDKIYGIEIKYRKNGAWSTNGNSVFESITDDHYDNIYLLFGSKVPKEKKIRVKFAPYWQTTTSIKVTHSPRFYIDMNNLENSVFESESDYNLLRKMDESSKVKYIQEYLSQNTTGAKWYTSDNHEISAIPFNELPKESQDQILAEVMILYPDDLIIGSHRTKYNRSAQYMIDEYYTFSNSLRDLFSASGQVTIKDIKFPRIIQNYIDKSDIITSTFESSSIDFKNHALQGWLDRNLIDDSDQISFTTFKLVLDNIGKSDDEIQKNLNTIGGMTLSEIVFQ